jgi:hypothetical protein
MSISEVAQRIANVYRLKYKKPIIEVKTKLGNDNSSILKPIKYNIEKLLETGFILKGGMDIEIEKTLSLCKEFIHEIK